MYLESLSNAVIDALKASPLTAGEILAHETIASVVESRPEHRTGLSPEQLGVPPRPPHFPRPAEPNPRHDVSAVVAHLVTTGKVVAADGRFSLPETG